MEYYLSTFHLLSFLCYKVYFCFVIHREMRSKFSSNISHSCSSFGGVRIIRKVNTFINTVRSSFYSLSKAETSEMITYSMFFVGCNTDLFLIQDSQVIAIDWGFSPQNDVYDTQLMQYTQFNVTCMFSFQVPLNLIWSIVCIVLYWSQMMRGPYNTLSKI